MYLTPVHTRGRRSVADTRGGCEGCTALPPLGGLTTRQMPVTLLARGGAERADAINITTRGNKGSHVTKGMNECNLPRGARLTSEASSSAVSEFFTLAILRGVLVLGVIVNSDVSAATAATELM